MRKTTGWICEILIPKEGGMRTIKAVLCVLLLFAVVETGDSKVKIQKKFGFYESFIGRKMTMTGNCDDADGTVKLGFCPVGIELTGLSGNKNIHLSVKDDFTATASGINQFGVPNHDATFVTDGQEIAFQFRNQSGGMCAGILRVKGRAYCRYTVQKSKCLAVVSIGDRVCAPCCNPCPDYGANFVQVYTRGAIGGVISCGLVLKQTGTGCTTCTAGTGRIISPIAK